MKDATKEEIRKSLVTILQTEYGRAVSEREIETAFTNVCPAVEFALVKIEHGQAAAVAAITGQQNAE